MMNLTHNFTLISQPRVFHVLTESEPFSDHVGGAVSRWVANVTRLDKDAIVLAPFTDDSWGYPAERLRIVKGLSRYKRLNEAAGKMLRRPLRSCVLRAVFGRTLQDLREGDTVWVHNRPDYAAALSPLVRRVGATLVLHLHNSHLAHGPKEFDTAIGADCYVFVSRFLKQEALEALPGLGRTEVLYSGADKEIFYPRVTNAPSSDAPVVLFAGRLVQEKGVHILLAAMRELHTRNIAIRGVVVGGAGFGELPATPYIQALKQTAPANVEFYPYCSGQSLGEKFREADIFCMPSCWDEPLGLVVLEAMASGLPVVATRSGGVPEMLAEGGGIVVPRNAVAALADALELLAKNASLRQRLAREAVAGFHRSFTWETVRENYRRIVMSVQAGSPVAVTRAQTQNSACHVEEECTTFPTSA